MATGITKTTTAAPDVGAADQLIDKQLRRVRLHIRITDLIAGLMTLLAGSLGFLLVAAVIDHWVIGLGLWSRFLALGVLLVGMGWYLVTRVVPMLLYRINPAFAAQTIERGEPSLKNSLLNYLLLRDQRAALHQRVLDALQQRAAADVSLVSVDQVVDRSNLIRAGYVLVVIMAVIAAYTILSPKDPIQTVRRVMIPWADIARPARVTIDDVQPGDTELFRGQRMEVSAVVRGIRAQEPVRLVYSTADSQAVNREVFMRLDPSGLRYGATLPPDREGVTQDFSYQLVAGDGATRRFEVRVIAAPVIEVEAVEYDYPAYTRRPREVVRQQGDIKALEGTRVTVRARTNQPIHAASLEFNPQLSQANAKRQPTEATKRVSMNATGTEASHTFRLELTGDRRTSLLDAYALSFTNVAGRTSEPPVVHRIDVVPDLAPEVEILTPNRQRLEIPLSGEQKVEIRAIDPDYGLSRLGLKAMRENSILFDEALLESTEGTPGQSVVNYMFRPKKLGLKPGDQVTYWGFAEDNRVDVESGSPLPNTARTRNYEFVIVPDPEPRGGEKSTDPSGQKQNSDKTKEADAKPSPMKPGDQPRDSQQRPPEPPRSPQDKPPADGDKQQGEQGSGEKQGASPKTGQQDQGGSSTPDQGSGEQGGGSNAPTGNQQPQPGQGGAGQQPGGGTPQQNGDGAAGTRPGDTNQPGATAQPGAPGSRPTEPLHDGDVFEKALQKIKREQDKQDQTQEKSPGGEAGSGDPNRAQEPGAKPQAGDAKGGQPTGLDGEKQNGGAKPGEAQPGQGTPRDPSSPASPAPGKSPAPAGADKAGQKPAGGEGQQPQPSNDPQQEKQDKNRDPKAGEGAQHPDTNQGAGEPRPGASGEGGKSARGGMEQPQKGTNQPPATDGDKKPGFGDNGESGAGQNSRDKTGSGSVEEAGGEKVENRDRDKTMQPDSQNPEDPGDPASNLSKHQSDSKGAQSGDYSGGGKQGPGQGAKQPGNDSAGTNSSSDDGASASQESGKGETSTSAGNDQKSGSPTGSSSGEKGPGSSSRPSDSGQQPGERNESQPPDANNSQKSQPPQPGTPGGARGSGSQGTPTGGGLPADRPVGTPPPGGEVPEGDQANLEYSRQATDMVLDYLKDQQDDPDRRLLDELGWTQEDLQAFVERWQKLKQSAAESENARRDLDDALRSLGLRRSEDRLRAGTTRSDDLRGLRESGIQSAPPASYQEQFKAFKKGAARGANSK